MIFVGPLLIVVLFVFALAGYVLISKQAKNLVKFEKNLLKHTRLKNYQFHHDFIGLVIIFISLFIRPATLGIALTGLGLGLFIHHLFTEGLKLITKDR